MVHFCQTLRIAMGGIAALLMALPVQAAKGEPPPEISVEEAPAPTPPPPELRAGIGKFKSQDWEPASLDFYAVLDNPAAADHHKDASFYLARCLERMGLPYAALEEYARFLIIGEDSEKFLEGFQKAVSLGEDLGAGWVLAPSLVNHATDRFSKDNSGAAMYWVGRAYYDQNRADEARAYLMSVPKDSAFYARARFLEGVVLTRLRRPKDAVQPFQEALKAAAGSKADADVREVANLSLARTYYALGNFERALEHYRNVPRDHIDWYQTLFERAWSSYMLGRLDDTLAELESVTAPFFDDMYIPEPILLQALVSFNYCKYQDGKKLLDQFTTQYKPVFEQLGKSAQAGDGDRNRLFESLVAYLLDGDRQGIPFPDRVLLSFERDSLLKDSGRFVRGVDQEIKRIGKIRSGWGDQPVAGDLRRRMESRTSTVADQQGGAILARLRGMVGQLSEFLTQAEIYKLEMITREKDLYTAAARGDVAERLRAPRRAVEVPDGYNYWPFEGEYWIDELGWYKVSTIDECKEVLRQ